MGKREQWGRDGLWRRGFARNCSSLRPRNFEPVRRQQVHIQGLGGASRYYVCQGDPQPHAGHVLDSAVRTPG